MATDERNPENQQHSSEDGVNTVNIGSEALYQPRKDDRLPEMIGSYRIVRMLGQGGMGTTYEAVQASPKRRVAIKVIKAGQFSESIKSRFEFEAQILARLVHPSIAQIYEAGIWTRDDGSERPFMAMEFVNGSSLTRYAEEHDLDMIQRLKLFQKVCAGVQYSHQRGVIHRDLKPDNILVHNDGQPKVIDFGVACMADSDLNLATKQTSIGQLVGTLQYMSPEQVTSSTTDLDTRSDVYALGVILYQLLCGSLPYDLKERAVHEAVKVIQEDPPTNPSTFYRRLRGDLETITLKALEKNRNRRYDTADQLSNDIRRYLENDPIEARPPSVIYRLGKFSRKHRGLAVAAMGFIVAILAGVIVSSIGWAEARRQTEMVEARNNTLDSSVSELVHGVMGQVRYLGNSANAQRALLDLARKHVGTMGGDANDSLTPLQQAQLAGVWMRIGKSHLSYSGVGHGTIEEAEAALAEAGARLDAIEIDALVDETLRGGIQAMQLDRLKLLAEAARGRAAMAEDKDASAVSLNQAASLYRQRITASNDADSDLKSLDVQYSSHMGLGNTLQELEDHDGARRAYVTAMNLANALVLRDKANKERRLRDKAIVLYAIATLDWQHDPDACLARLHESVDLARAIIALSPANVRRPRDLALMLALRGKIRIQHDRDRHAGIKDYREAVVLLTTRALQSPRETASQQDYERTLLEMSDIFAIAKQATTAREISSNSTNQMQCVAEAEERAGFPAWIGILERVQRDTESSRPGGG